MTHPDEIMVRLGDAMARAQQGDRTGARAAYQRLWDQVGPDGDPFHRCAVAHSMADVQDEPHDERTWDRRALDAAEQLTDERVAAGGVATPAAGLLPSLHLNLADVSLRLGDLGAARHHVAAGRAALPALPDDGYRATVEGGLRRVEGELGSR